ncbi:MAG: galactose-1-epimerase, partial [Planctomycetota bacterium]|nr:galactose-1-epimerase [Planctomycetota bacterium]
MKTQLPLLALALGAASCMNTPTSFGPAESVRVSAGEADASGRVRITLTNERGMEVEMTNLGATVTAVRVPDRDGAMADVTLGFDDLDRYDSSDNQYFGCTVGRVANRIAEGRFELGGSAYTLATNNDPNHLHGGDRGFGVRVWSWEQTGPGEVTFRRTSADGEEGYPG